MTRLYEPTAAPRVEASLAPRVDSLNGKVIGLLDISKPKGNYFLDRLAERLCAEFQPKALLRRMKPTYARPAPEELRKELAQQCDLIIEALAD
ncbi:MAG: hypothetical protein KatS3mg131_1116 [Candidatus Tectimicrobiota bacterium]|nr:MAG: hypothetical protein KatS3mg131_1116 [Candidatus Tectomicrobia bacterium]